jgi:hypothetical protein
MYYYSWKFLEKILHFNLILVISLKVTRYLDKSYPIFENNMLFFDLFLIGKNMVYYFSISFFARCFVFLYKVKVTTIAFTLGGQVHFACQPRSEQT